MGETTAISWTHHTFQPWMGCSKVSPGCDHCYAEALGKRTGRVEWGDDAERVLMSDAYWRNPVKWNAKAESEGVRRRVFCASLADVFEDRDELLDVRQRLLEELVAETPWLDWQLLTKRPQNVLDMVPEHWLLERSVEEWAGWPDNAWIGTTVEDQERADERIPHLLKIPAVVRFLSCEPLLGPIDLTPWLRRINDEAAAASIYEWDTSHRIGWVIAGGESGPKHRPMNVAHARAIRDACQQWDVPFFFKQTSGQHPGTPGPDDLESHKEFPHAHS